MGNLARRDIIRLPLVFLAVLACLYGIWNSGREGLSQLFAGYGSATNRLDVAERAVQLGASIPEAHDVRAGLLFDRGEMAGAIEEYERALALRPQDYAMWLELGRVRDQAGDTEGAIAAFKQSVRLAPFYAQPHWQLGNTLYRAGRRDEALAELRRAAASEPKLLPQILDLAWATFAGDAQAVEQSLQPQTPAMHLALARYFARRGKTSEALAQFRAAGDVSEDERRSLLTELLAQKRFREAHEVWSSMRLDDDDKNSDGEASVINGGFESPVSLNETGFGWQLPKDVPAVRASQDTAEPHNGTQSLRLDWNGNSATGAPIISQLLLVGPNEHYQLHFAARTEQLVTAGLPQILVTDASRQDGRMLGAALTLPQGTNQWQDYNVEFKSTSETTAVQIIIRRENCSSNPCPIFGRVWLDDFSVKKL